MELQDGEGRPITGFALADSEDHFGNYADGPVRWKGSPNLASLVGQVVRLRFVMSDADVYAIQFR